MNIPSSKDYLRRAAQTLLCADSPSGFTLHAVEAAEKLAAELGYAARRTGKGGLVLSVPGRSAEKKIGLCAHLDTLGLMCSAISKDGELYFTPIGGPTLPTLDGEYCRIYARDGRVFTGTILSRSPAAHVFDDAKTRARDEQNMYVRLDEVVQSAQDVRALGLEVGDYICYEPKTVFTESGFLKSRFLDDKASAACLFALLFLLKSEGKKPQYSTEIHLTVYEEVGHGGATISQDLDELVAVDMGCIGLDLSCTERQVSICCKDSAGPYDYELTGRLAALAKAEHVPHAIDVYPHYSSDVAVSWRAGSDAKAALIGPGVHASHGMERTHMEGLLATVALLDLYLGCG